MNKYLANSLMFKFAILFYLLFIISISPIYAGMDAYQKQHKRQDAERYIKHKKLKNTDISRRQIQALTKTLPVDTDNDGMPDSWESDNIP